MNREAAATHRSQQQCWREDQEGNHWHRPHDASSEMQYRWCSFQVYDRRGDTWKTITDYAAVDEDSNDDENEDGITNKDGLFTKDHGYYDHEQWRRLEGHLEPSAPLDPESLALSPVGPASPSANPFSGFASSQYQHAVIPGMSSDSPSQVVMLRQSRTSQRPVRSVSEQTGGDGGEQTGGDGGR